MSKGTEGHFDTLPIGRLGLIPLNSSAALGKKVDDYLVSWRKGRGNEFAEKYVAAYEGYERDSYIIQSQVPRFGSGEAKGIINESVRGDDIYILLDVCNYSLTYSLSVSYTHLTLPTIRLHQPHVSGRPLPGSEACHRSHRWKSPQNQCHYAIPV